jgi:F0F1-type ATP synthase assembly protein I
MDNSTQSAAPKPRYVWPWYLAAAVVLGIVIAVFSIRAEANRIKLQRSLQMPTADQ